MRASKVLLSAFVALGLTAGCAERPGKKKDDGKADKDKKGDAKAKAKAKAEPKEDEAE